VSDPGFVHLHVHSSYSLLEGALTIAALGKIASADRQPALALTDTNNLFGALEFSEKFSGLGIQPIAGLQLTVEFEPPDKIRPGQVGTLIDESADPLDVSATIVDLAVRGYLTIEEIPKHGWRGKPDWTLTKKKDAEGLLRYEELLLNGLFDGGDVATLWSYRLGAERVGLLDVRPARGRTFEARIGALGRNELEAVGDDGSVLLTDGLRWDPHTRRLARGSNLAVVDADSRGDALMGHRSGRGKVALWPMGRPQRTLVSVPAGRQVGAVLTTDLMAYLVVEAGARHRLVLRMRQF